VRNSAYLQERPKPANMIPALGRVGVSPERAPPNPLSAGSIATRGSRRKIGSVTMKTKNKISAYILRSSTGALLFSCVIVALCSAIHLPEQPPTARPPGGAVSGANGHQSGSLSFAERVAYQRAIEDVYWRHRIWPKERPDRKPSLDAVMSQATIEQKVQDYLRNSELLEQEWQKPITPEQLQAEMDRMAQHSKQPEVLRELFAALGNDPFVIAECLARPVLPERFAQGDLGAGGPRPSGRRNGPPRRGRPVGDVPPVLAVVATPLRGGAQNVPQARGYSEPHGAQVPVAMAAVSSANYTLPVIAGPSG